MGAIGGYWGLVSEDSAGVISVRLRLGQHSTYTNPSTSLNEVVITCELGLGGTREDIVRADRLG